MACFKIAFAISMVTLAYSQTISIRPLGGDVFWEGGGPIDLKCIVLEDRFSNVYWIRDNTTVWSFNDEILVDLSPNHKVSYGIGRLGRSWVDLYIETAQRKHTGFYTCLAEDPVTHEQIEAHQYIRVKHVPLQTYPLCLADDEGDPQSLKCVSEPGSPEVMLKWFSSAVNSTELASETVMEKGLLTRGVKFGNLYAPEGELLSSDTLFICKMYIEDYGALRSCSFDAQEIYALNSSFNIFPSDLSVVFGESFVATCVSSLPLATFTVTLHLPNRPPKRPRTIQIDNGEALVIHNINFDYNGAIFSCQMGWGPFYGRTKMSRITVTPYIEPIENQQDHDIIGNPSNSQGPLDASPVSKPNDTTGVNRQQNEREQSNSTSPSNRYTSPTIESEPSGEGQNTNEHPTLLNPGKKWTEQLPSDTKKQNGRTLSEDNDGYPSTAMSETEIAVQNEQRNGTNGSPTASSERSVSTSEGASNSVTATKREGEETLSDSVAEDVWPNNMINDALHGNNIHDLPNRDQHEEVIGNRDEQSGTSSAIGQSTLNGKLSTNGTSLDSSETTHLSNVRSSLDTKGNIDILLEKEGSSPVGDENFNGNIESFKMFPTTSWTSEKSAGDNGMSATSDPSYGMPRRPDVPMENGTYNDKENVSVMLAIFFILTSFLFFLVFCFILGFVLRKCYQKRQRNNVKTVIG